MLLQKHFAKCSKMPSIMREGGPSCISQESGSKQM